MNSLTPKLDRCWAMIGVMGDRSCPELSTVTHCRNCPMYAAAGRRLLDREISIATLQESTRLLAETKPDHRSPVQAYEDEFTLAPSEQTLTVLIFRLQQEWLALSAAVVKEITVPSPVHTLPQRSNQILLGVANIRGELLLCASLSHFLNLDTTDAIPSTLSPVVYPRMVVMEKEGQSWVFSVDELYGMHRLQRQELNAVPSSVSHSLTHYAQRLFTWNNRSVSYLDDELLFHTLNKKVL